MLSYWFKIEYYKDLKQDATTLLIYIQIKSIVKESYNTLFLFNFYIYKWIH